MSSAFCIASVIFHVDVLIILGGSPLTVVTIKSLQSKTVWPAMKSIQQSIHGPAPECLLNQHILAFVWAISTPMRSPFSCVYFFYYIFYDCIPYS